MKTIAIEGTLRTGMGKKSTKALRNIGLVPCVVYGGAKNVHFTATTQAFRDLIYTNEFRIAAVNVDGDSVKAIIKDVQFHPITDKIMHIDFLELVDNKKLITQIPITLTGAPEGVKVGGVLMQKIRKVKVKTTPDQLSASIEVNVEHLDLGKSIRIRDIKVSDKIEIMNSGGIPIASVEVPRALRSSTSKSDIVAEETEEA